MSKVSKMSLTFKLVEVFFVNFGNNFKNYNLKKLCRLSNELISTFNLEFN